MSGTAMSAMWRSGLCESCTLLADNVCEKDLNLKRQRQSQS